MNDQEIKKVSELVREALITDGAHHKQFYLDQILEIVDHSAFVDYTNWKVDMGIQP